MAAGLVSRGPDHQGTWADETLGLGMTRLAIVDTARHEIPYTNEDGNVCLVYNGEVYNHLDIRRRLTGRHAYRSNSDTETLVHAYEELGIGMVDEFNGMYAFALADLANRKLYLVRDQVGEKPL